jgi:hypothetical protein
MMKKIVSVILLVAGFSAQANEVIKIRAAVTDLKAAGQKVTVRLEHVGVVRKVSVCEDGYYMGRKAAAVEAISLILKRGANPRIDNAEIFYSRMGNCVDSVQPIGHLEDIKED